MIIVDTNLLIYAYNSDAPAHDRAAAWLVSLFNGDDELGFAEVVLIGFIRIVTQARIMPRALAPAQAIAIVRTWLALSNARLLLTTPESFALSLRAIDQIGVAGNLCTDAQIAALALTYKATVATVDSDFQRFAGIKLFNPLRDPRIRA